MKKIDMKQNIDISIDKFVKAFKSKGDYSRIEKLYYSYRNIEKAIKTTYPKNTAELKIKDFSNKVKGNIFFSKDIQ